LSLGRSRRTLKSKALERRAGGFRRWRVVVAGGALWRSNAALGAEAGAWGGKSSRRRFGFLSPVAGSGGDAGCVYLGREGRESCAISGVGWCLRRVRGSETACQASNSQRFGWCGSLAARLVALFAVAVGRGVGACRSELVSDAVALSFGVSCFALW
jgi:hypothetical protein